MSKPRRKSSKVVKGLTHYETIGCAPGHPQQVLELTYWALAKQHHPDKGGALEDFVTISEAWSVLKFASTREAYDKELRMRFAVCDKCDGRGFHVRNGRFSSTIQLCTACQGQPFQTRQRAQR